MAFKFELLKKVEVIGTHQTGEIRGRCEYSTGIPNTYFIYGLDAEGDMVYRWKDEQDITG